MLGWEMQRRSWASALVSVLFLSSACHGAGAPDAGTDAPLPPDAGVEDLGTDAADLGPDVDAHAGDDAGPPDLGAPDMDVPCDGPPGLYVAHSCTVLAPGVHAFTPRYVLWSDAAEKERFIFLPAGTQIDTTDPDHWLFPVGTTLWKHFALGGHRLETRLLAKSSPGTGPLAWSMRAYLWDATGTAVHEVPGGMNDVLGTTHDVPAESACPRCHNGNVSDLPLGFSAIQLNHSATPTTLDDVERAGWLTTMIPLTDALVPGAGTTSEALGYLHSNCGPCHSGAMPSGGMDLHVAVGLARPEDSAAYLTAVNHMSGWTATGATLRVAGGMPDASTMVRRMAMRGTGTAQMPPLATELVDGTGLATVRDWITTVPP